MKAEKKLERIFKAYESEDSCQAGQNLGMSIEKILDTYFISRNSVLKILRLKKGLTLREVAEKVGLKEKELEEMEVSKTLLSHRLVVNFSKVLGVELKILLVILGLANQDILNEQKGESKELLMAAQYSGPDLTKQDKVNLEELFRRILNNRKGQDGG